jgi:putative transcriptional regulator
MHTIRHHPDDATLMSFAAGSLTEALAAVVASHLDVCATCRRELRLMQQMGGALLETLPAPSLDRLTPVMALHRQEADVVARPVPNRQTAEVPQSLARLVKTDLDNIPWRRLGVGVWHHRLPCSSGDLRLLRVAAGRRMPEHGHGGSELTLMLRGSYHDETGTYQAGDVADLDDDIEHTPVAHAETGCICLIASEKPAKFKGLISRLVQPLTGM